MPEISRFGLCWAALLLAGPTLPAPAAEPTSHIVMVGDTMLGNAARSRLAFHGYDFTLRRLGPLVAGKDWLVGNLEGPLTDYTLPLDPSKLYAYHVDPQAAPMLRRFGFDMMCLANNHVLDYGPPGLRDTLNLLGTAGIRHFGAGYTRAEAQRGEIVELKGVKVGFLGFMQAYVAYADTYPWFATSRRPGVARMSISTVQAAIRELRPRVNVLIVSFHWGRNYRDRLAIQQRFARLAIDAGASLVVGHHPHVPQGVELYKGVPILYSLGNFAFGSSGRWNLTAPILRHGWVADIALSGKRLAGVKLQAIATDNLATDYQARPDPKALPELVNYVQRGLDPAVLEIVGDAARVKLSGK